MSNKEEVKLIDQTLAIEKLAKVHLKLSQNIGFIKYFSSDRHEELEYLNELEQEIRESLGLLGYNVHELNIDL